MAEVELSREGLVGVVTLNRPEKRNAMSIAMQRELLVALGQAAADDRLAAMVLTAAGADFCVGGDLEVVQRLDGEDGFAAAAAAQHRDTIAAVLALDIPVIAAVEGAAFGFGAELVACCDIVLMAATARLADPHVHFGLAPAPVTLLAWPQQASRLVAAELIMTGREIPAEEAVALGLASRVVPAGTARAEALALAGILAAMPAHSIGMAKRALRLSIADLDGYYPQALGGGQPIT